MQGARRTRSLACESETNTTSVVTTVGTGITRNSERMVLSAYLVLSGDAFRLVTFIGGYGLDKPERADAHRKEFNTSNG